MGLQGGSPHCYGNPEAWNVSAFAPSGALKQAWLDRLGRVLDAADSLGMVPIVQFFYAAQFSQVAANVDHAVTEVTHWLLGTGHRNFIVEVFNEKCDAEIARLVDLVHNISKVCPFRLKHCSPLSQEHGQPLLTGSSCLGGRQPSAEIVKAADFILLHGNGQQPEGITELIAKVRAMPEYQANPKPIVFNEDDHGHMTGTIGPTTSNLGAAVGSNSSWGFLCCCDGKVQGDYNTGYQCPPVNWGTKGPCLSGSKGLPMPQGSKEDFFAATAELSKST